MSNVVNDRHSSTSPTEKLLINKQPKDYWYVNQAEVSIAGVDDQEEYQMTDVSTCIQKKHYLNNNVQEAFTVLNFSDEEKFNVYKTCAALLHMGEMTFKQRPREEQAEPNDTEGSHVAKCIQINAFFALCRGKLCRAALRRASR